MAVKRIKRDELVAQIVEDNKLPCAFCKRTVDDELNYGKLYAIGDIQCHYFCALLSCCLVQKAKDEVGLFGFLYQDILAEIARAKKHKCSYCLSSGANMGCSISQCRKQFHLPCGRERNAVSLFYGSYKSYCQLHAPKQNIPENIMAKARLRKRFATKGCLKSSTEESDLETVCVICYEEVPGYPTTETFWPPCCAKDAWFHRTCLQRMSLSAGMHYLKCPLCNDKENFYKAVVSQGYYVPDRDAAWELEQNAFAEIYERPVVCGAVECQCPMGRNHDVDNGPWDIKLCILCGSTGIHAQCQSGGEVANPSGRYVCATCQPAAPADLESLAESIEAVILAEQNQNTATSRRRPVMPSRMSLRRTKRRVLKEASSTSAQCNNYDSQIKETSSTIQSREQLNLKPPKRQQSSSRKFTMSSSSPITSPIKLLEQSINEKSKFLDVSKMLDETVVEKLKRKLQRPRPLSAKRRIVNNILDGILSDVYEKDKSKEREPIREWCSPKKCEQSEDSTVTHETADRVLAPFQIESNNTNKHEKNAIVEVIEVDNELSSKTNISNFVENDITVVDNDGIYRKEESTDVNKIDKINSLFKNDKENITAITLKDEVNINHKNVKCLFTEKTEMKETVLEERLKDYGQLSCKICTIDKIHDEPRKDGQILYNIDKEIYQDSNEINNEYNFINNNEKLPAEQLVNVSTSDDIDPVNEHDSATKNINSEFVPENTLKDGNTADTLPEINDNTDKIKNYINVPETLENIPLTKNLKTIDIENDSSVEISKDNQVMHIDVVKIENTATETFKIPITSPIKNKKCFIKFGATDKEVLQNTNFNLDVESFKNQYLSEVDGERAKIKNIRNITDVNKKRKRKLDSNRSKFRLKSKCKRRKADSVSLNDIKVKDAGNENETKNLDISKKRNGIQTDIKNASKAEKVKDTKEVKRNKKQKRRLIKENADNKNIKRKVKNRIKNTSLKLSLKNEDNVQVAIDTEKNRKNKKVKTKLSVKIKWREERLNLKITKSKRKKEIDKKLKCLKQYVLKYKVGEDKVIAKPEADITPPKRKYVKHEKPQDKLVQTVIESFFKKIP